MQINKNIENLWSKLFEYWLKKKPDLMKEPFNQATEEDIDSLKAALELKFPNDFLDSFRVCNENYRINNDDEWLSLLGGNRYILNDINNTNDIIYIYNEFIVYNDEWEKNWIAFYDWNGNYYAILDTNETTFGKIYCYSIESGQLQVWANSYEEWLEMAVDEVLEYGELRLETIEAALGIQ